MLIKQQRISLQFLKKPFYDKRLCSLFTFLLLNFATTFSQIPSLHMKYFSRQDGLLNQSINHVAQDSTGFIWIASRNGLFRYDGYSIHNYYKAENDSTSISSNVINYLFTDSDGYLWIGTSLGLCIYNEDLDNFNHLSDIIKNTELANLPISHIAEDKDGNILFTNSNNLFKYNKKEKKLSLTLSLETGTINSFLTDSSNNIWIGSTENQGLLTYNLNNESTDSIILKGDEHTILKESTISDLALENGRLWIATVGNGIYSLETGNNKLQKFPFNNYDESMATKILLDRNMDVWSVDFAGLKFYDKQSGKFIGYYPSPNNPYSLKKSVKGIFLDKQGNYWIYHAPGGVGISMALKGFNYYNDNTQEFFHTTNSDILSLAQDTSGNLWIGNSGGGIDVFDFQKQNTFRLINNENDPHSIAKGDVMTIFPDSRGIVWFGTYLGGLQYYDAIKKRVISFKNNPDDPRSIAGNDIRSISEDSEGNLWLAIHGKGVDKMDRKTKTFTHYNVKLNKLSNNWSFHLLVDHNDNLWVGTVWGLNFLKKGETTFTSFLSQNNDSMSLTNSNITAVFEDANQTIWIGTPTGLNRYNPVQNNFTRFTKGFSSNYIAGILSDDENNLWISHLSGISLFDHVKMTVKNFNSSDGLISDEFNAHSFYKSPSGTIYFGGVKGIVFFNPAELVFNTTPPDIIIDRFKIFNEEQTITNPNKKLQKHISKTKKIVLEPDDKVISIRFKALNFINPDANQYAYKLEGFERNWNYTGSQNEASYTNLDPGQYTFKVIAANNDEIWNTNGTELIIKVLPPWYGTLAFKIFVVLLIIGATFGYNAIRTFQLNKQKNLLELSVAKKTSELTEKNKLLNLHAENLNAANKLLIERQLELEQKSSELTNRSLRLSEANSELQKINSTKDKLFSIIAHDLANPFNTILGFSELLTDNYDELSELDKLFYIKSIHNSSEKLYNLLHNLLIWARTQTSHISIHPKDIKIAGLIEETVELNKELCAEKEITVKVDCKDDIKAWADPDMVKTILRNLFSNALKFTSKNGIIRFIAEKQNGNINISITDTGVGISQEKILELLSDYIIDSQEGTSGEKGSGLGLIICKDFIKINNGELLISSEVGNGSTFTFTLPEKAASL